MQAITNNGVLVITNDEAILELAKGDDIIAKLSGKPEEIEAQRKLIEQQRDEKTLGLRDDVQSLAKLADLAKYTADRVYYAKLYVSLKEKLLKANELANAQMPQVERYTVTSRDI